MQCQFGNHLRAASHHLEIRSPKLVVWYFAEIQRKITHRQMRRRRGVEVETFEAPTAASAFPPHLSAEVGVLKTISTISYDSHPGSVLDDFTRFFNDLPSGWVFDDFDDFFTMAIRKEGRRKGKRTRISPHHLRQNLPNLREIVHSRMANRKES